MPGSHPEPLLLPVLQAQTPQCPHGNFPFLPGLVKLGCMSHAIISLTHERETSAWALPVLPLTVAGKQFSDKQGTPELLVLASQLSPPCFTPLLS